MEESAKGKSLARTVKDDVDFDSRWPFETDFGDHFETPDVAYHDVQPCLRTLARRKLLKDKNAKDLSKKKKDKLGCERIRIYDPYYCDGRMKKTLAELGFMHVINNNRDFYEDIEKGTVPEFDVLVTNPPYSGDHKEKLFNWVLQCQRVRKKNNQSPLPFLLLLPSWTTSKKYYRAFVDALGDIVQDQDQEEADPELRAGLFYVCPTSRYEFHHPAGAGRNVAPFHGIWFCGGFDGPKLRNRAMKRLVSVAAASASASENASDYASVKVGASSGSLGSESSPRSLRVARSLNMLQEFGYARTEEEVKTRLKNNPKQKLLREQALKRLEEARKPAKKRKKLASRPHFSCDETQARPADQVPEGGCVHFFSGRGCNRKNNCRWSHETPSCFVRDSHS